MKRYLLILALLLPHQAAYAAVTLVPRTFTLSWTHDCETVQGDNLDLNGDGICEGLRGFRIYTEPGLFVTEVPADGRRTYTVTYPAPYGTQCHQMTAVMDDPVNSGQVLESAKSNVGACHLVEPGDPEPPTVTN